MRSKTLLLLATSALLLGGASAGAAAGQDSSGAASRPAEDQARDANRKPAEVMAFAGLRRGQVIADIMPGQGYYTRLFSGATGVQGRVFAVVPSELTKLAPHAADLVTSIAADPAYPNVTIVVTPIAEVRLPQAIDIAWTSNNYHDLYALFGPEGTAAFDQAVFKALKPGGVFIVLDHVGPPGMTKADALQVHRISPEIVKAQVLAAGFVLDGESEALRNPADDHTKPVFSPDIRGRTDQFIYKFRKPL